MATRASSASAPKRYSADQLAALPPDQRNAALANMNLSAAQMSQLRQQIGMQNVRFMQQSIPQMSVCPTDANALSNTYNLGTTLNWVLPQQPNGFATDLYFDVSLTPTYVANGTSPYFDKNASWPYSFFSRLQLLLNDTQIDIPLYILPHLHNLIRYDKANMGYVDADYTDATVQSQMWSDAMPTGNLKFTIHLPLNRIHDYAPAGALPMSGVTRPVVKLTCASSINGVDPTVVCTTNATTWTVAGSVTLKVKYLNGMNTATTGILPLDLSVEPTVQITQDNTLQPMVGGLQNKVGILTRAPHYYVLAFVIDGNQSNQYSTWPNIASFGLFQDFNASQPFFTYGSEMNTTPYDWLMLDRDRFGRDLQNEGVFPLIKAPETGIANVSNRDGYGILNMQNVNPGAPTNGAWAATFFAVKPTTVGGVSGIVPRIETYVVSLATEGLKFY